MTRSDAPLRSQAVRDNPAENRFELDTEAGLAWADYRSSSGTLIVHHTEVPRALRGQGIGAILVRGVLDDIRRRDLKVVPCCGYVRSFIARNPEFNDLLP
jgi:uncharacterized protein